MMNDHIRSRQLEQPFSFKHIKPYPNNRQEVKGPCVVMATPGTLEGGLSGRLMAQWCSSVRNGVILTGFLPEGTPAKELTRKGKVCVYFSELKKKKIVVILSNQSTILVLLYIIQDMMFESDGVRRERNCSVHEVMTQTSLIPPYAFLS
jgi:Cft2 family RNA processing exonuclease